MKRRVLVGLAVAVVLAVAVAVIPPSIPVTCDFVWPLCLLP